MNDQEIRECLKQNGLVNDKGFITGGFENAVFLAEIAAQLSGIYEMLEEIKTFIHRQAGAKVPQKVA